jgi:hypothetical protein
MQGAIKASTDERAVCTGDAEGSQAEPQVCKRKWAGPWGYRAESGRAMWVHRGVGRASRVQRGIRQGIGGAGRGAGRASGCIEEQTGPWWYRGEQAGLQGRRHLGTGCSEG